MSAPGLQKPRKYRSTNIVNRQGGRRPGVICIDQAAHVEIVGQRHLGSIAFLQQYDVAFPDDGPVCIADHVLKQRDPGRGGLVEFLVTEAAAVNKLASVLLATDSKCSVKKAN